MYNKMLVTIKNHLIIKTKCLHWIMLQIILFSPFLTLNIKPISTQDMHTELAGGKEENVNVMITWIRECSYFAVVLTKCFSHLFKSVL